MLRGAQNLCFTHGAEAIRSRLKALEGAYQARLDALLAAARPLLGGASAAACPRALFRATFGKLADADGHAALASAELTLPALVSGDPQARAASSDAKKALLAMWAQTYARADLHAVLKATSSGASGAEERRFADITLAKFVNAGAALPTEEVRAKLSALDRCCAELASEIEQHINEDTTTITLTDDELAGCPTDFIAGLPKSDDGSARKCSLKAPVLVPILRRASSGETRRKAMVAAQSRCQEVNGPLLDKLLTARHEAAVQLGFQSHAERMLALKMARTAPQATAFCEDIAARVRPLRDAELGRLSARKAAELGEGGGREAAAVEAWDTAYYSELLKREELQYDDEAVKEFFPLQNTIDSILLVYAEMLSVTFERSNSLPRWAEEVSAFEVKRDGEVIGHLYLDQFPRDGKFGHQMVVPLAPSFVDSTDGVRCVPACVNISNLPRAVGEKPALLRWDEMKTLFHELGHCMHCLCTTTAYSGLSWAWPMVPWPGGVEQDFLEVPSMALEKFAVEPALIERVAKHYSLINSDSAAPPPQKKARTLGAETLSKIEVLEKWMVGMHQSRFFALALFDMHVHSSPPPYELDGESGLSVAELFGRYTEKHTRLKALPGTNFSASWYHLVIGYDAGFYSYGWSDVYAADVFEAMMQSEAGPLSAETGAKLRDAILGPCASVPGEQMLKTFLGREPNADAWCQRNGIPAA